MPKVSVCIPCYKQTEYLKRCLDSVFMQDLTDMEIIITDDTPDDTVKRFIEKNYASEKLHYYKNAVSLGTPQNWNEAIGKAKGEYIKLLHHDDFFTKKNSLNKMAALLETNKKAGLAFCATEVWNVPSGKRHLHKCSSAQFKRMRKEPEFLFFRNMIGSPSATISRRTDLLYDKNLKWLVDIEYYIRQIEQNPEIAMTNEALICTADNTAGQVTQDVINDKQLLIREHLYVLSKINKARNVRNLILFTDELFRNTGIKTIGELRSITAVPEELENFLSKVFAQLNKKTTFKKTRNRFYGSRFNIFKFEKY
jgi:glycosyltransferase involved in cell wall biosynthesis